MSACTLYYLSFCICSTILSFAKVRVPHPLLLEAPNQKVFEGSFFPIYTFVRSWTSIKDFIISCFPFAVLFSSSRSLICHLIPCLATYPYTHPFCLHVSHSYFISHLCNNFRRKQVLHFIERVSAFFQESMQSQGKTLVIFTRGYIHEFW